MFINLDFNTTFRTPLLFLHLPPSHPPKQNIAQVSTKRGRTIKSTINEVSHQSFLQILSYFKKKN